MKQKSESVILLTNNRNMKKALLLIFCLILFACKEKTIPVVSLEMMPAELVALGTDSLFDTIPYNRKQDKDTILLIDTVFYFDEQSEIDTFRVDTFQIDTFFMDTILLQAHVAYRGDQPYGPALQECGFYVNKEYIGIRTSEELQTAAEEYGTFSYILPVRNTAVLSVYACVSNPSAEIQSRTIQIDVSDFDDR